MSMIERNRISHIRRYLTRREIIRSWASSSFLWCLLPYGAWGILFLIFFSIPYYIISCYATDGFLISINVKIASAFNPRICEFRSLVHEHFRVQSYNVL